MSRLPDSGSSNIGSVQDFALREKQPTAIGKLVSKLINILKKKKIKHCNLAGFEQLKTFIVFKYLFKGD